ncbi:hypothetical protein CWS72_00185 [Telmatospirillum siberiense]|uniref:Uncharacterized protein n=2 Tax=Telmatospirillum siberiense TaxID=382514 RepID=A0A2N3Q0Y7_9PROT|nr:hypothetical protein CWS72_00185 [Telmatospirillum siberiense]
MISPARADDVAVQIEAARAAYGKGDPLHALAALQAATLQLNQNLVGQFGKLLPVAPRGWVSSAPELQALDGAGGGLEVTEAYSKGEATLNVSLIIDNPAVASSMAMVQEASRQSLRPGWSKVKLGTDDAVLRFDPQTRAGEVVMVIGDRALLQIEGNEITKDDVLLEAARGWNLGALRKLIGIGS